MAGMMLAFAILSGFTTLCLAGAALFGAYLIYQANWEANERFRKLTGRTGP